MKMTRKNILTGLVLFTLLMVVGVNLGLVGSQARRVAELVLKNDCAAPAPLRIETRVRAGRFPSFDSASAVLRRCGKVGAEGPSGKQPSLLSA